VDHLSFSDATVTLRSLPRRYREIISGPVDDPSWERVVRTPTGKPPRSALGWTAAAAAACATLADVIDALPVVSLPVCELRDDDASSYDQPLSTPISTVLETLTITSTRAADALDGRRSEDGERRVVLDGAEVSFDDVLHRLVSTAVGGLRKAQHAIDQATR
jgi:hypothetical protein